LCYLIINYQKYLLIECEYFIISYQLSETSYRWRVAAQAALKYLKAAMKAEGFATDTTSLPSGYRTGSFVRAGISSATAPNKGLTGSITTCDDVDVGALVEALAKHNIRLTRRAQGFRHATWDRKGYGNEELSFMLPDIAE
jgi:hypothetical protein